MDVSKEIQSLLGANAEESLSIVRKLREVHCCFRCCLRFLSCRPLKLYAVPEQDLGAAFAKLLDSQDQASDFVCTACLGCLSAPDNTEFSDDLQQRFEREGYQTKQVNLSCTLPISMLSRDHLLALYLRDTLKIKVAPREPKEPFKHLISKLLRNKLGLNINTEGSLRMTVVMAHEPTATEHMFLTQAKNPVLKVRKKQRKGKITILGDSRSTVAEALNALSDDEARSLTSVPPSQQTTTATLASLDLMHDSVYLAGRYIKLSREFSQTPWSIKGKKLAENSVSESICELIKTQHRCDGYKFVSAGREDANVRMLGTGRPFYLELINPRVAKFTQEEYDTMQNTINSSDTKDAVQLRDLTNINPKDTKIIKEGEQFKRKTYRALVWMSDPVTQEMMDKVNAAGKEPFKIQQNTPARVFQRRAGIIREKEIHYLHIARPARAGDSAGLEKHFAVVTMNTQAGTYIKEFVHGDLGRTQPNLASLAGTQGADLIELDVMEVDLAWPPKK
ncbi:trna pseudouridine synthase pus10 [Lichtheimia corymbifera JMRC:FSU:9682]|uniref:tRNA pseudouridine(55) synthase n=1 Tax=Lichtheimia corymbifera JMRC:FSU:9682 TaxID=1263082 RepID=A0A068SF70_9FUNG|nr:trna pseudouridine synthase pus10 [Lichtheimia corymbifera JMRC:FSU:9682]CDH61298.1 trna pseudouridine synthase pus10 [Lichtheimia corymbifera JMRC:FSU:9682]